MKLKKEGLFETFLPKNPTHPFSSKPLSDRVYPLKSVLFLKFSFEKETVDGEKKRKLLPVLNPETGKMEDRYAEVIQREMNDEDDESSEEEENKNLEDELDGPLTEEEIRKIQQEMNQTWPKRLANVSL